MIHWVALKRLRLERVDFIAQQCKKKLVENSHSLPFLQYYWYPVLNCWTLANTPWISHMCCTCPTCLFITQDFFLQVSTGVDSKLEEFRSHLTRATHGVFEQPISGRHTTEELATETKQKESTQAPRLTKEDKVCYRAVLTVKSQIHLSFCTVIPDATCNVSFSTVRLYHLWLIYVARDVAQIQTWNQIPNPWLSYVMQNIA